MQSETITERRMNNYTRSKHQQNTIEASVSIPRLECRETILGISHLAIAPITFS